MRRINWRRRGEDVAFFMGVTAGVLVLGAVIYVLEEAVVVGARWAQLTCGVGVALAIVASVWAWLTQDDFEDRA